MTPEKQVLYIIQGAISEAPAEDREIIKMAEVEIRAVLKKYPDHAPMAVALIGAELAAKE